MKRIVILGSTGSIGQNAMSVVAAHPDEFEIVGLSTNQSVEKLEKQMDKCKALKEEIKTIEASSKMLMQAILKEAFEFKK